jgi:hypothetical protein
MAEAAVTNNSWLNVRALYGDSQLFTLPEKVENAFKHFAGEVPPGTSIQVLSNGDETTLSMRIPGSSKAEVNSIFNNLADELKQCDLEIALEENNEEITQEKEVVLMLIKKSKVYENFT